VSVEQVQVVAVTYLIEAAACRWCALSHAHVVCASTALSSIAGQSWCAGVVNSMLAHVTLLVIHSNAGAARAHRSLAQCSGCIQASNRVCASAVVRVISREVSLAHCGASCCVSSGARHTQLGALAHTRSLQPGTYRRR
jgi:hypothetical protein